MGDRPSELSRHSPSDDALLMQGGNLFFDRVLAICPKFAPWDEEDAEVWKDDDGQSLHYVRIAGLARYLIRCALAGEWADVNLVFELAEVTLETADSPTRGLMVVGLFEDVQNFCLQAEGAIRLADFRPRLGPLSAVAWDEIMAFWYGTASDAELQKPGG